MSANMKTVLIAWFAFLTGIFVGLMMAHSLSGWEGWLAITINVVIIWVLHKMASDIRRFPTQKP